MRDVGVAAQEPEQLVDDGLQVHLLGGDEREAGGQIEAHLMPEHAERAGAGAIGLANALGAHATHEVEVLLHGTKVVRFWSNSRGPHVGNGTCFITSTMSVL